MQSYLTAITLSISVLAGSFQVLSASEISGKITLKGTPPPERVIQFDPICGKQHSTPVTTRHYMVGKDKGLGNVFVYIKTGAAKTPPTVEPPVLDQVDCIYTPFMMGVVTGQKFKVRNSDPLLHNVHATPKPGTGNKEFNFAQVLKGQVNEKVFDAPEVLVRIKCDVHPWMGAYVGVMENPFFAVSGADGSFSIAGLPAGNYTVVAWHEVFGEQTMEVTVPASASTEANFTFKSAS